MEKLSPRYGIFLTLVLLGSCHKEMPCFDKREEITVELMPLTKSKDPDPALVSDCNIFIFNDFGLLEEKAYVKGDAMLHKTRLLRDTPYLYYVAANLGYELPVMTLEECREMEYHIAYPDEYSAGIPMSGYIRASAVDSHVSVPLKRLMAKIDLRMDRTALDPDVNLTVAGVRIGACPRSAEMFRSSRADNFFPEGFSKSGRETDKLNTPGGTVSLYLLENMQGNAPESMDYCSYVEVFLNYLSPDWKSRPGEYLIYRFRITDSEGAYNVERNCEYSIVIRPEGRGLSGDSWRIDTGALSPIVRMELHPAAYNQCSTEESYHIWCDVSPKGTRMEIEALAYEDDYGVDKIYDYTIDSSGYGVTIKPKKGGTAVIYFKAGPPVNRDTLAMLVISEPLRSVSGNPSSKESECQEFP